MSGKPVSNINIYISSSTTAEDLRLLGELERQLGVLRREAGIRFLDKRSIIGGANRQHEITAYINQAHVVLLLLSPDFLASDECYAEMQQATRRMMNTR